MYFSLVPNIEYDTKPTKFPFSSTEYIVAKNFFRRFKFNEDAFNYTVFFNKYAITDSDRLDLIAERYYGSPFYDWVIVIVNNMIDPIKDWPMDATSLRKQVEESYDNPDGINYYKTTEIKDSAGKIVLKNNLKVDEKFYNTPFKYFDSGNRTVNQLPGNNVCSPVTNYEHENEKNELNREIYLLKDRYFEDFINEFRKLNLYQPSSNYISKQLKRSGK
jgi:hypothetical protein